MIQHPLGSLPFRLLEGSSQSWFMIRHLAGIPTSKDPSRIFAGSCQNPDRGRNVGRQTETEPSVACAASELNTEPGFSSDAAQATNLGTRS